MLQFERSSAPVRVRVLQIGENCRFMELPRTVKKLLECDADPFVRNFKGVDAFGMNRLQFFDEFFCFRSKKFSGTFQIFFLPLSSRETVKAKQCRALLAKGAADCPRSPWANPGHPATNEKQVEASESNPLQGRAKPRKSKNSLCCLFCLLICD